MINFWEIRKERERELSSQNIPWETLLISAAEELLKLTMPFNSCGIGVEYTTLELSKDISGEAMNYIYIISKKKSKIKLTSTFINIAFKKILWHFQTMFFFGIRYVLYCMYEDRKLPFNKTLFSLYVSSVR